MERFRACFADLADPRSGNAQRHELMEILLIALAATLAGAESCVDMAEFGRAKEPFLRCFLTLPGGIPSPSIVSRSTILAPVPPARPSRVRGLLRPLRRGVRDPDRAGGGRRRQDRAALVRPAGWARSAASGQRPSGTVGAGCCAVGSARGRWACEQQLVLGQRNAEGSEITALPELLTLLCRDGCTVTADALHCQKATARAILDRGGDYVLALKGNQPTLLDDVRLLLDDPAALPGDRVETTDGDHGRIEIRRAEIVHDVAWLAETHAWPGLQAVGKVTATREIDGRTTTATRYYLLSQPLAAARFAAIVRAHWQIENRLHWVLDTAINEDRSRSRKDHGPENLARLRRFALNLIRTNPDRRSTRGKIKPAAWDDRFLLRILTAA